MLEAVIRTHNSASSLPACLQSLAAQEPPPAAIRIMDSGSTDNTIALARKQGAHIHHYPPHEPFNYSRSLNLAIRHVRAPWCLIISSHSALPGPPNLLPSLLALLTRQKPAPCAAYFTTGTESSPAIQFEIINKKNFDGFNGLFNTCAVVKTELLLAHPFDESLPACEDQYWAADRFRENHSILRILSPRLTPHPVRRTPSKQARDALIISRQLRPDMRKPAFLAAETMRALKNLLAGNHRKAMARWLFITYVCRDRRHALTFTSEYR